MNDADLDFAVSLHPDRWRILGLKLEHYCEGHRINLKRVGSPFVNGGPVSGPDLILALLICSRSWERGQAIIERRISLLRVLLTCVVALGDCIIPRFSYNRSEALAQYIQEAERLPRGIIRESLGPDGKPVQKTHAPIALVFFSDISSHYHMTLGKFMNLPLRATTFLRYRLLEIDKLIRWKWWPTEKQKEFANG
jgi:hypothetical protein